MKNLKALIVFSQREIATLAPSDAMRLSLRWSRPIIALAQRSGAQNIVVFACASHPSLVLPVKLLHSPLAQAGISILPWAGPEGIFRINRPTTVQFAAITGMFTRCAEEGANIIVMAAIPEIATAYLKYLHDHGRTNASPVLGAQEGSEAAVINS